MPDRALRRKKTTVPGALLQGLRLKAANARQGIKTARTPSFSRRRPGIRLKASNARQGIKTQMVQHAVSGSSGTV